jgi:hypothetical protein
MIKFSWINKPNKGVNFQMKNKTKTLAFKNRNFKHSFSSKRLTHFAGLAPIMKFIQRIKLPHEMDGLFPTPAYNATKWSITQLMLAVVVSALSGVCRLTGIAHFTHDPLVKALLGLPKGLNKDVLSVQFKKLGQRGARLLEELAGQRLKGQLEKSGLQAITLDGDSLVKTVYGHQEGAAKAYNPFKKGAKSYHPILIFASELKLVLNSWFRTGAAYTSNGIIELLKQSACYLPSNVVKVFFRADSGFFYGALLDFLEELGWDYLIKVKLKNLKELLQKQKWQILPTHPDFEVCEFAYQGKDWQKARILKAVRWIDKYEKKEYFGHLEWIPIYSYACYMTSLQLDAYSVHEEYKLRATSETWIEQIKSQLYAGMSLTDDFWANDILWQLAVLAYNLSVMMRLRHKQLFKQEHRTFRDWFIKVPALVKGLGCHPELQLSQYYSHQRLWEELTIELSA